MSIIRRYEEEENYSWENLMGELIEAGYVKAFMLDGKRIMYCTPLMEDTLNFIKPNLLPKIISKINECFADNGTYLHQLLDRLEHEGLMAVEQIDYVRYESDHHRFVVPITVRDQTRREEDRYIDLYISAEGISNIMREELDHLSEMFMYGEVRIPIVRKCDLSTFKDAEDFLIYLCYDDGEDERYIDEYDGILRKYKG